MFTRELECRLRYIRSNQSRLRSLEHNAALMAEESVEESDSIYLPASFLGSRLWVSNQIADSLAIAAAYGPLTFFITFTCNSNWPEIQSQLRPGQDFTDIPSRPYGSCYNLVEKLHNSLYINSRALVIPWVTTNAPQLLWLPRGAETR